MITIEEAVLHAIITNFTLCCSTKKLVNFLENLIIESLLLLPYGTCAVSPTYTKDSFGKSFFNSFKTVYPPIPLSKIPIG